MTLGDYDVSVTFPPFLSLLNPFSLSFGLFDIPIFPIFHTQYSQLNDISYPNLAKTVFILFMIFVPILLLNMLIAMMGEFAIFGLKKQ